MIRDRLVLGIRDEETRKQLICDAELTLDTAIAICRVNEHASALKMKSVSVQTTLVPEQGDKITTGGNASENWKRTKNWRRKPKSKATAKAPISNDDQRAALDKRPLGERAKFAEVLKPMNQNKKNSMFLSSNSESTADWRKLRDNLAKILQADPDEAMEEAHAFLAKIEGSVSIKAFIEIVTMAVIKASLKDGKLVERQMNKFDKLILKYVDNTENLELICLFAIKNFVVKEAALELSVLTESFRHLHDDRIISVEAFKKWKDDTSIEPLDSEGRLLATKTLEPFYVFLAEAEDYEEES
uniref:Eukaryotic translation initiation factor 4 gamma 3 n=1 Tax=Lygus hesperus TaxID=30085 RepID=A0A0A9YVS7_LYGHE